MALSREHELLENLLAHPAWEHIVKPVINEKVKVYLAQLLNPSQARKDSISDDHIRGAIEALRWVVTYAQQEIDAAKEESLRDEAAAREAAEEVPLFGGGRPITETGEDHGRSGESGAGQ
jgi:hypothetical protein